jgi:hypothetical protein
MSVSSNDKQELDILHHKLFEKLYHDISKKHNALFRSKDITLENFSLIFHDEFDKHLNYKNPDYKKFFTQMERIILKVISKLPDKFNKSVIKKPTLKKEKELYDEPTLTEKQKKELAKKNNEWAKIAKFESEQFISQKQRQDLEDMIAKQLLQDDLKKQIEEKKEYENREKERNEKFYNEVFVQKLERLDLEEKEKCLKAKELFLRQKELLLSSIEGNFFVNL